MMLLVILAFLLSGCATTREPGKPLRTAIEQLLMAQALERTLETISLPIPDDSTVLVEAAGLTRDYTPDQEYVCQAIAIHLAKQGFRLALNEQNATYRISVLLQTFGTEQGVVFFGIPPVQSMLLPVAVPEVALYKDVHQTGTVRLALNVIDQATGRLISSSPWHAASTYYNNYTVLLLAVFRLTNLELPE